MMRSLFSGVSGLKSHQTRMDVIGNNIANINTIGFKSSRTTFSDMLSQLQSNAAAPTDSRGGVNAKQIGLGANVESIDLLFTDASPQQTGKNTDLALSGNALFVLKSGEQAYYTRNGAFSFDEEGHYVMPGSGLRVQGWNATPEGNLNTNALATDIIVPVGKTMEATATTAINYSGNLNSQSLTITKISYTEALGGTADDVITKETVNKVSFNKPTAPDGITYNFNTNVAQTEAAVASGANINLIITNVSADGKSGSIYDPMGNLVGTVTSSTGTLTESTTVSTTASTDSTATESATSVNVDSKNVLSAVITLSDGTTRTVTSGYYEVGKSIPVTTLATVYDSEGGKHQVTLLIDKDSSSTDIGAPNTPDASALSTATTFYRANKTPITNGTDFEVTSYNTTTGLANFTYKNEAGTTVPVTGGKIGFDNRWRMYIVPEAGKKGPADASFDNTFLRSEATGNPEDDGSLSTGKMNNGRTTYIYFDDRGQFVTNGQDNSPSIVFSYGDGNGSSPNTATIDLTGLTQYANNTTSFPSSNGNTSGVLQSVAVDGNGVVSGTYTNGLIRTEAQIAVAQFTNSAGLTKVGTTIYTESNNSGEANIKTVADFGVSVLASALEMSNVDLATEFSDMIITQRGFQANSKMTTVSDEMLETLVNMKR